MVSALLLVQQSIHSIRSPTTGDLPRLSVVWDSCMIPGMIIRDIHNTTGRFWKAKSDCQSAWIDANCVTTKLTNTIRHNWLAQPKRRRSFFRTSLSWRSLVLAGDLFLSANERTPCASLSPVCSLDSQMKFPSFKWWPWSKRLKNINHKWTINFVRRFVLDYLFW